MYINVKRIKRILGKSFIEEYPSQIVFTKGSIEIDFEKDFIDIILTDKYGNTISIYEINGSIKKVISSRSEKKRISKLESLSNILMENIYECYPGYSEEIA